MKIEHVTIYASDIEASIDFYQKVAGPLISPRPDVRFFFISDPDGFQVQFIEVPEEGGTKL